MRLRQKQEILLPILQCHENSEEDTEIDSKVDETVGIKEESMTDIKEKDNNNIAEEE